MKRGYIRLSKAGPTLAEQKSVLESAGIYDFSEGGPVFIDEIPKSRSAAFLPQRVKAVRSLEPGDELVVSSASRLGISTGDVLDIMKEISDRQAVVYDADSGEKIVWHPDAVKVIEFARHVESENRKEIAAKMRQSREASGRVGGAPEKLSGDALDEAKRLWADTTLSSAQVAEKIGINVRTLYRRLGDRGGKQFGSK